MINESGREFLAEIGLSIPLFLEIAETHGVDPALLLGIAFEESKGNASAMRYERGYPWTYMPIVFAPAMGWTESTELELQKFSWGICQIMLATARELGFHGHPMKLYEPGANFDLAAQYLRFLFDKYASSWENAVSAYNQGSPKKGILGKSFKNQAYVDRVFAYAKGYRA